MCTQYNVVTLHIETLLIIVVQVIKADECCINKLYLTG